MRQIFLGMKIIGVRLSAGTGPILEKIESFFNHYCKFQLTVQMTRINRTQSIESFDILSCKRGF